MSWSTGNTKHRQPCMQVEGFYCRVCSQGTFYLKNLAVSFGPTCKHFPHCGLLASCHGVPLFFYFTYKTICATFYLLSVCSSKYFYIHILILYNMLFLTPVPPLKPFAFRCDWSCCPLELLGLVVSGRIYALSLNLPFPRNELLIRWEVRA